MVGIILQPGAFNPLHRMHIKIAEDAILRFPDYFHSFILSSQTCDKGIISLEELRRRRNAIKEKGFMCSITKSGLFIDHIKNVRFGERGITGKNPPMQIVFAVGEDTLYRFFRDWEKFFTEDAPKEYKFGEYYKLFERVTWYITKREMSDDIKKYKYLVRAYERELPNIIWSGLDLDSISSTKIRNNEVENECN